MNHTDLVSMALPVLHEVLDRDNVILQRPQMGAEDFAVFAELVPAFYFMLGVRNEEKGITAMLHTQEFDVDEDAIPLGVELLSRLVLLPLLAALAYEYIRWTARNIETPIVRWLVKPNLALQRLTTREPKIITSTVNPIASAAIEPRCR